MNKKNITKPDFFKDLLNSMHDLVLVKSKESKLLWANKAFLDYYGLTESELIDIIDGPQSSPDDTLQYIRDDQYVLDNQVSLHIPSEQVADHSGKVSHFNTIKSPVRLDGKKALIGISRRIDDPHIKQQPLSNEDAKLIAAPLRSVINIMPVPALMLDKNCRVVGTNSLWQQLFKKNDAEILQPALEIYPEISELITRLDAITKNSEHTPEIEIEVDNEGKKLFFIIKAAEWRYKDQSLGGFICLAIDNSESIDRQKELEITSARLKIALEASGVGVWEYDLASKNLIWDESMFALYGIDKTSFEGIYEVWENAIHPEDKEQTIRELEEAISKHEKFDTNFRIVLKDGDVRFIRALADVIQHDGVATKMIGANWDITNIREKEKALEHLAHNDTLSNLKNRFSFNKQFKHALNLANRNQKQFALMLIDLDGFKKINDSYGHQTGDKYLTITAERIEKACRNVDLTFRLGGDEFAIIVDSFTDATTPEEIAKRTVHSIRKKTDIDTHTINGGCSIGIAVYPHAGTSCDALLKNADIALYKSKNDGKNCYNYFTESLNNKATRSRFIRSNLIKAANFGDIYMLYQPVYDIKLDKVIAAEALARWDSEIGAISPGEFILDAEKSNEINILGEILSKRVCSDLLSTQSNFKVSINCSSKQLLGRLGFAKKIMELLKKNNIKPSAIIIEITESYLISDYDDIKETLKKLHKHGIEIAIDNFGTNYSSISMLANIPFQYLKIDKRYIANIDSAPGYKVLKCILNVANSFGAKVIVEGIETVQQKELLISLGVNLMQGHLFSKAKPINQV